MRAVEILYAFDEALRLIDAYERPDAPAVDFEPRAAVGHGVSEAPRGLLYHRYEIDDAGKIVSAWIVPPTSQNQRSIEEDLREFVAANVALPDDELRDRCEQTIRNYDPCISCSTHFLQLEVERERVGSGACSSASATRCAATTPPGCWRRGRCARWAPEGVEVRELEGEPVDLIEAWEGAEAVVVADAVASGGEPGRCTGSTPPPGRCRPPWPAPRPTRWGWPRRSSWAGRWGGCRGGWSSTGSRRRASRPAPSPAPRSARRPSGSPRRPPRSCAEPRRGPLGRLAIGAAPGSGRRATLSTRCAWRYPAKSWRSSTSATGSPRSTWPG